MEGVARLALELSGEYVSEYGAAKSRHDFKQKQLMACLILRAYLKTTYRGVIDLLRGHGGLRRELGMERKLPHYTTLQKFGARSQVEEIADAVIARIGRAALKAGGRRGQQAVAMDATGLETAMASAHFVSRAGRERKRWLKLSLIMVCGSLLPLGSVLSMGPDNDKCQAEELLEKSLEIPLCELPQTLYADAGYDAHWIHAKCREQWGIESVIKPVIHRRDGTIGGEYRHKMTRENLARKGYGKRWHIESFFSGFKRMMGSSLSSRTFENLRKEAALRLLAYSIHR